MSSSSFDVPTTSSSRKPISLRQVAAIICAGVGLLGWLCRLYLMGNYNDGEKLARFFQALVNVVILTVFGGTAAIASTFGVAMARWKTRSPRSWIDNLAFWISFAGLGMGAVVLVVTLPAALTHLQ